MKLRFALPTLALISVASVGSAHAQDTLWGYQFGVVQTVGTSLTDDELQFTGGPVLTGTAADAAPNGVQRVTGGQLNTTVTANATLDLLTNTFEHGLLFGVQFDQLVPVGVPDEAASALRDAATGITGNANYVTRLVRPTYGLALGAGYAFVSNGRLDNAAAGNQAGVANDSLPGAAAGPFLVNGQTHTINLNPQLQLTQRNWDLNINPAYVYTDGGVFNLNAVGGANADGGAPAPALTAGAFARASSHSVGTQVEHRYRFSGRNNLNTTGNVEWLIPLRQSLIDDPATDVNETDAALAANAVPQTIVTGVDLQYLYDAGPDRRFGVEAGTILTLRAPDTNTPTFGADMTPTDEPVALDAFIYAVNLVYIDRIRAADLNVQISLGVAQPTLLQPPLGVLPAAICRDPGFEAGADADTCMDLFIPEAGDFDSVRAPLQPVGAIRLQRTFDPVEMTFDLQRAVDVGALGAGAVITDNAQLALQHELRLSPGRSITTEIGFNAIRVRGAGSDLFGLSFDEANALAATLSSFTIGANAAIGMPLFEIGSMVVDATIAYDFAYVDLDPDGTIIDQFNIANEARIMMDLDPLERPLAGDPTITHTGLLTLRAVFGRGTLQTGTAPAGTAAAGGGGGGGGGAFSADPRTGSPLATSGLVEGEAALSGTDGDRPGRPPRPTSQREAQQKSQRQKKVDKQAAGRQGVVSSSKTVQQAEADALDAEKKRLEEAKDKRTREFGEWPMGGPTPEAPEPPK